MTIYLTPAQQSALECAGLELDDLEPELLVLRNAWNREDCILTVTPETILDLYCALTDRSNAEDAANMACADVLARRASKALGTLAAKIIRS